MVDKDYNSRGLPWNNPVLYDWDIGVINHYNEEGQRRLFVLMTKGNKYIKAEGHRELAVWEDIKRQAIRVRREEDAGSFSLHNYGTTITRCSEIKQHDRSKPLSNLIAKILRGLK